MPEVYTFCNSTKIQFKHPGIVRDKLLKNNIMERFSNSKLSNFHNCQSSNAQRLKKTFHEYIFVKHMALNNEEHERMPQMLAMADITSTFAEEQRKAVRQ